MSPRNPNEQTPIVDDLDRKIAEELVTFRVELDRELATRHTDEVTSEHPLFVNAAQEWMVAGEQAILAAEPGVSPTDARLRALNELHTELKDEGEDPALLDIVNTFLRVTKDDKKLGYDSTHDMAA